MRHHLFLALSDPTPHRDDEFHRWYDAHHLQDVVDFCPGFVRGRRYWRDGAQQVEGQPAWRSLAIYDLEADDVAALHARVSENVSRFTPSGGVFAPDHAAWVYTPVDGGATPSFAEGGDGERVVLLAFFDELPAGDAVLERNSDQRRGESPAWPYLVVRDVPASDAGEQVERIVVEQRPSALWIFRSRGGLHVTDAEKAASLAG
jgi:hypothetical protein